LYAQLAAAETSEENRAAAGRQLKTVEDALRAKLAAWEVAGERRDALVAKSGAEK
jgi:hypothetical protein